MPEKKLRASASRGPPLDEILAYRKHVDAAIAQAAREDIRKTKPCAASSLGLEHEQQHLELAATDIKHAFFTNPLQPAYLRLRGPPSAETMAPPVWSG